MAIAAFVAFFNASSSAQLARLYPSSGGTYVYAKERLNGFWAWVAGWGFVFGKLASCLVVAFTLPIRSVIVGSLVMLAGIVIFYLSANNARQPACQ